MASYREAQADRTADTREGRGVRGAGGVGEMWTSGLSRERSRTPLGAEAWGRGWRAFASGFHLEYALWSMHFHFLGGAFLNRSCPQQRGQPSRLPSYNHRLLCRLACLRPFVVTEMSQFVGLLPVASYLGSMFKCVVTSPF